MKRRTEGGKRMEDGGRRTEIRKEGRSHFLSFFIYSFGCYFGCSFGCYFPSSVLILPSSKAFPLIPLPKKRGLKDGGRRTEGGNKKRGAIALPFLLHLFLRLLLWLFFRLLFSVLRPHSSVLQSVSINSTSEEALS
jgi:hypothetical protein